VIDSTLLIVAQVPDDITSVGGFYTHTVTIGFCSWNHCSGFCAAGELAVYKEQHLLDRSKPLCFTHFMVCLSHVLLCVYYLSYMLLLCFMLYMQVCNNL